MALRGSVPVGCFILLQAFGCSGRSLRSRGSSSDDDLTGDAVAAPASAPGPAPAVFTKYADLSEKDCSTFSKAFMLVPQTTCTLSQYDGGWAGCSCDLPLAPIVKLADVGSSGHADSDVPEPVTATCPFEKRAGSVSEKSFSLEVFGFSQVQSSSLGAESSARQIHTCNYLMKPGDTFSFPEVVNKFRSIRDQEQKPLGIQCGGASGIQKSDTMIDLCRRWLVSLQASCAETWSDVVPDTCKGTEPPFGITEKSTVHDMCSLDCAKPGKLDIAALAGKIEDRETRKKAAAEEAQRRAREKLRREAQEEQRKKEEIKEAERKKEEEEKARALRKSLAENPGLKSKLAKARAACPDCTLEELMAKNPDLAAEFGVAAPAPAPATLGADEAASAAPASAEPSSAAPADAVTPDALADAIAAHPEKSVSEVLAANPELAPMIESVTSAQAPAPAFVIAAAPGDSNDPLATASNFPVAASPSVAPLLLPGSPASAEPQSQEISELKSEVSDLKQTIKDLRGQLQAAAAPAFATQDLPNPYTLWSQPGAPAFAAGYAAPATAASPPPTQPGATELPAAAAAPASAEDAQLSPAALTGRLGPA